MQHTITGDKLPHFGGLILSTTKQSAMSDLTIYIKATLRIAFVILNNLYCLPTYMIWIGLLLPVRKLNSRLFYKIEGTLVHWLLSIVTMWSWSAGYSIVEQGDNIEQCFNEKTLVLCNHQSTGDVPMLMAALNPKKGVLENLMWIMDRVFKYTNFGVVSTIHRDFFIQSGKDNREDSVKMFKSHLTDSYIPIGRDWMVLFPEGGFLWKRRENSHKFANKHNLPVLHHVTLPRLGALYAIRDTLLQSTECLNNNNNNPEDLNLKYTKSIPDSKDFSETNGHIEKLDGAKEDVKLKYILDITIAYPEGKPLDLQTIAHGMRPPCETHLYYRVYPCSAIPTDDEGLKNWIYDRFVEKEALLDTFYKTNQFIVNNNNNNNVDILKSNGTKISNGHHICNGDLKGQFGPSYVQQDILRFFLLHLFFLISTYVHLQLFYIAFYYLKSLLDFH